MALTQRERVIAHIREFGYIDRMSALIDCGVFELSARIIELEDEGYTFSRKRKTVTARDGSRVSVTEYRLSE